MIPILKLPLDLFLYDFSRWAYLQGVNPFLCEEGTRTLSIMLGWLEQGLPLRSGIQLTTADQMTFTLADLIEFDQIGNLEIKQTFYAQVKDELLLSTDQDHWKPFLEFITGRATVTLSIQDGQPAMSIGAEANPRA